MKSQRSKRPTPNSNTSTPKRAPIAKNFSPKKRSSEDVREKKPFRSPVSPVATANTETKARPQKFIPRPTIDDDRRVFGIHAVRATLEFLPTRAKKLLYIEQTPRISPLIELARQAGILVEQTQKHALDLAGEGVHQGVMLLTSTFPYLELTSALERNPQLVVVLDEIEDPRNLGRAARSALALGAQLLVIPENRAASVTANAEKAAVGAFSRIAVAKVTNLNQALDKLKREGFWIVGAAGDAKSLLWESDLKGKTAIVIGNEESGLRKLVKENCDQLVQIPMNEPDMSLNAADALTIMLYEAQRQKSFK